MANQVVVDTDVISLLLKEHSKSALAASMLMGKQIIISFMTVAELRRWEIKRSWGSTMEAKLSEQLDQAIMYPADLCLCQRWAEVKMEAEWQGRPISAQDAWIAATALQNDLPLMTNNSKDFQMIKGLVLLAVS